MVTKHLVIILPLTLSRGKPGSGKGKTGKIRLNLNGNPAFHGYLERIG
jgi:hypothetical protein